MYEVYVCLVNVSIYRILAVTERNDGITSLHSLTRSSTKRVEDGDR